MAEQFLTERENDLPVPIDAHEDDQAILASGKYPYIVHDVTGHQYHHVATTDTGVWIYRKATWT